MLSRLFEVAGRALEVARWVLACLLGLYRLKAVRTAYPWECIGCRRLSSSFAVMSMTEIRAVCVISE